MFDEKPAEVPVEVPYAKLAPETLQRVIEDLVTRDGTDYGAVEKTLEHKAAALMRQLERGEAKLVMDLATETLGVMTALEFARATADAGGERPTYERAADEPDASEDE